MCAELFSEIEGEVTNLLSELIRINTSNPPGNETRAAKFLAQTLEEDGLESEVLESSKDRGNVITRIKGSGEKPSLLLLSHLDVVPATPKEWSVDPFSGLVKEGHVWGRGALDCKSLTAVEVMVMKLLMRNNVKLKGDVILAATADEEMGGSAGVGWLVENHPQKIKADYVINEGGGFSIPMNGKHVFTVQVAEKGIVWLRIRAHGTPGHGSIPGVADNSVLRMAEVVSRLGTHRSKIKVVPAVKRMVEVFSGERGAVARRLSSLVTKPLFADRVLDQMAKSEKGIAEFFRALLRTTIAPTMIRGGIKENVIPSECEGVFDCRILPGQTKEMLMEEVKRVLKGIERLEFEYVKSDEPSESPYGTDFYDQARKTVRGFLPDCSVVPFMVTGGTDSRYLRRLGSVCYGFHPLKTDMPIDELLKMAHGIDERISVENLVFGTSVLYQLVKQFMT